LASGVVYMIEPFPQDWQLIGLFECEPSLLDPDVPWVYNRLRFLTERGPDRVECEIEPASEIVEVRWWQSGLLRLHLDLRWVRSLAVEEGPVHEALVAEFRYGRGFVNPLVLQLRPHVSVSWGTNPLGE
jgi:hypothetical protein